MHRSRYLLAVIVIAGGAARPSSAPRVLPGIDVLLTDSAPLISGKRLGLITNRSGVDGRGVRTIDRLARWPGARLVALFAPEHGFRGTYQPGESFRDTVRGAGDTVDVGTGLPIYSLYGPRRAPAPGQLDSVDVLLVDLQDVGARPFTFVSTTVLAMRAAAAAGRRIVVLDRVNPVGCAVQGPVLDTANASFVGMLPVPLRHGMTIGELARLANAELRIGADLVVVPVQGWRRCAWFEETRLPWVRPSPNLPDMRSVEWYPGTVLFEATNLSVGRGTDAPFREVGAPWMDAGRIAALMRRRHGLSLTTLTATPQGPGDLKYGGVGVHFVRFGRLDRRRDDPIETSLQLLRAIRDAHPDSLRVDAANFARHFGRPLADRVEWSAEISAFMARRASFLLYR